MRYAPAGIALRRALTALARSAAALQGLPEVIWQRGLGGSKSTSTPSKPKSSTWGGGGG